MQAEAAVIVILGITGDLAKRKLLPALSQLHAADLLHDDTVILGSSRREVSVDDVLKGLDVADGFAKRVRMTQFDPAAGDDANLRESLVQIGLDQRLFYLSIPPETLATVVSSIADTSPSARLLIEKPFGHDLTSATQLAEIIHHRFEDEAVYLIDHYAAKEMVQNIATVRQHNPFIEQLLSNATVSEVRVRAHEALDIEGRADFYEQTGALRDLIQSHLLQIAGEIGLSYGSEDTHVSKQAFLESLTVTDAVRGQYNGYRQETEKPDSVTETFAALKFSSADPRWTGVPFILETGKALAAKLTDVRLTLAHADGMTSQLIFSIDPEQKICLALCVKQPGFSDTVVQEYLELKSEKGPEAYERIFYDALRGEHRLFITPSEALACWRLVQPVLQAWQGTDVGLATYEKGSTGPNIDNLL